MTRMWHGAVKFVLACGAFGCAAPSGVDGWIESTRGAAESVCGCASAIGHTVSGCLDDIDAPSAEDAAIVYDCWGQGIDADPSALSAVDCLADSMRRLDDCASESTSDPAPVQECLDRHQVRQARCPEVSGAFHETADICLERAVLGDTFVYDYAEAYADVYVDYEVGQGWYACVLPGLDEYRTELREHAICVIPYLDRLWECDDTLAAPYTQCDRFLQAIDECPPLRPEFQRYLDGCTEAHR